MITFAIGRITQAFIVLLTLRLANTFLIPSELGKMSIIMTTAAFITMLFITPVGMYINRHFHEWYQDKSAYHRLNTYWLYMLLTSIFTSCLVFIICNLSGLFNHNLPPIIFCLVFLVVFIGMFNQTSIHLLNMLGLKSYFIVLSILTAGLSLVLAILYSSLQGASITHWLEGIIIGQLAMGLIALYILMPKLNPNKTHTTFLDKPDLKLIDDIIKFALPISLASILTWVQTQGYQLFIYDQFGLHELGLFFAGYSISYNIITGFESIFATYLQPKFYQAISTTQNDIKSNATLYQEVKSKMWNGYAKRMIPNLIVVILFIIIIAPNLQAIAFSDKFSESIKYLKYGLVIEGLRGLANVYHLAYFAEKNTKDLIMPSIISVTSLLSLSYLLSPIYGIYGICSALLVSWLLYNAILHLRIVKKLTIKLPLQEIYQAILLTSTLYVISKLLNNIHPSTENLTLMLDLLILTINGLFLLFIMLHMNKDVIFTKNNNYTLKNS